MRNRGAATLPFTDRNGDGLAGMTYLFAGVFLDLLPVRFGIILARWE
jgi:hypothetical protein